MQIIIYVVDCLRADHLSSLGYERRTTPTMDALADDGILYENCFTPSTWTRPASVSVLSGMYPPAHGVRHRDHTIPDALPWLPTMLRSSGFDTQAFSAIGNVSSTLGYDRGFDQFEDLYLDPELIEQRTQTSAKEAKLIHHSENSIALPKAEDITEKIVPSLSKDDDQFSLCWGIDLHMPLDPPEDKRLFSAGDAAEIDRSTFFDNPTPEDRAHLRNLYDDELRYVDTQLGRIVERLQSEGKYDDSLLVVLGDHGEAHGEHGFYFHGNRPYDELISVPLIVKPPAETSLSGHRIGTHASLIDVVPSILKLLDLEIPDLVQGVALPPIDSMGGTDRQYLFSETQLRSFKPAHYSVHNADWKFMLTTYPPVRETIAELLSEYRAIPSVRFALSVLKQNLFSSDESSHLFARSKDPAEQTDISADNPSVAVQYREVLEQWLAACRETNDRIGANRGEIDEKTVEQLRQLGYT